MTQMQDPADDTSRADAEAAFGEVPAAEGSALTSLRDRRKARKKKLKLDLRVPGYDPDVYVRFRPAAQAAFVAELRKAEKSKDKDAIAIANANIVIEACAGIFQVAKDGTEVSIDPSNLTPVEEDWLTFGPELGALLADEGEFFGRATDVVRALWDNDMALDRAVERLLEWSRTMNEEQDRDDEGN